ncbi:MAG: hypothetical protein AVDCRST_MAG26-4238, partial [uncultured Chloroflexia bacterium]
DGCRALTLQRRPDRGLPRPAPPRSGRGLVPASLQAAAALRHRQGPAARPLPPPARPHHRRPAGRFPVL